jgi:hypothetical protein
MADMLRGHPIRWDGVQWVYCDTGEPTAETWESRPCGACGRHPTPDGYDACHGYIVGAINACCGHGSAEEAYVQLADGSEFRGKQVRRA